MARLYVDESLGGQFVVQLRERDHDVVFAGDAGTGKSDAWHFREAVKRERLLLTLDRSDYQYFHRLWTSLNIMGIVDETHHGILVAIQAKGFSQSVWVAELGPKLASPDELKGRMSRWHPTHGWHEDQWKPED